MYWNKLLQKKKKSLAFPKKLRATITRIACRCWKKKNILSDCQNWLTSAGCLILQCKPFSKNEFGIHQTMTFPTSEPRETEIRVKSPDPTKPCFRHTSRTISISLCDLSKVYQICGKICPTTKRSKRLKRSTSVGYRFWRCS